MRKGRLGAWLVFAAAAAGAFAEPTRVWPELGNPSGALIISPAPLDAVTCGV